MAARKPRKTAEKNAVNEAMLLAIKAAVSIQKGSGLSERQTHCRFIGEYVVATDDVMIVGVPVKGVSFICCPHSKTLLAAIERCQNEIVFTLDNDVLTVKSGRIRVPVPCLSPESLGDLEPDNWQGNIDGKIKAALAMVATIVDDRGDTQPVARPVYLGPGVAQGTLRGHVAMQVWHGDQNLPALALPRSSAEAIGRHPAQLTGLGISNGSATFWFEDNSFIRTRLHDQKPPNFDKVLEDKENLEKFDNVEAIFEAVKTMLPLAKDKTGQPSSAMIFSEGHLWAGSKVYGASLQVEGIPFDECGFNGQYVLLIQKFCSKMSYSPFDRKLYFYSDNIRGAISGVRFDGEKHSSDTINKLKAEVMQPPREDLQARYDDSIGNDVPY